MLTVSPLRTLKMTIESAVRTLKIVPKISTDKVVARIFSDEEMLLASAVKVIDDIKDKINEGEAVGIACLVLNKDGTTGSAWSSACGEDPFITIAGMEFLKQRFMNLTFEL